MELSEIIGIVSPTEWNPGSNAMPSGSARDFEEFARDCVRLAEQADTQELREKLLNLAREWMRAVIEEEDTVMSRQAAEYQGRPPAAPVLGTFRLKRVVSERQPLEHVTREDP